MLLGFTRGSGRFPYKFRSVEIVKHADRNATGPRCNCRRGGLRICPSLGGLGKRLMKNDFVELKQCT